MKKLLVVDDYQYDFVEGTLGFSGASKLLPRILELIAEFQKRGDDIVFIRDEHDEDYLHTEEGHNLPVPHCLKGTPGEKFYGPLEDISSSYPVFVKHTFGSKDFGAYLSSRSYYEIVFCGLDASICVFSNAIIAKTFDPSAHIVVDSSATSCGDPAALQTAFSAMRRLHIEVRDLSNQNESIGGPTCQKV